MNKFLLVAFDFVKKYWVYIVGFIGVIFIWRWIFISKNTVIHKYDTGGRQTISKVDAQALADRLYLAMADIGTNNDDVAEVFVKISSNADNLRLVYNAFGIKDYGFFGSSSWFSPSTPTDLKGWLHNELPTSVYNKWLVLFNIAGIH